MADAKKGVETKVDETTNQEAPLDEENKGVETTDEKSDSTAPESNADESTIDYKAELERVKNLNAIAENRLKRAEHKIVELKKGEPAEDEDSIVNENDDDPYGIKDIVKGEIDNVKSSLIEEMMGDVIQEELKSLAESQEERDLIEYHYKHTIRTSGTNREAIRNDLQAAYLLANQKKFLKENIELKEAIKSRATKSSGDIGSNQKPLKAEEGPSIKLSAADIAFCKKRGIDPKTIKFEIK